MEKLKENGIIVYLKVSPEELQSRIKNIHTRGIAMKEGTTIKELYEERAPLYEKYADMLIGLIDNGFAGAIYTQTTDVEIEVNGLMTYDRKVVKLDMDRLSSINRRVIESM